MEGKQHVVLVTAIGGDVGVGCLRNLRRAFGNTLRLIGTNTVPNPSGSYLCDTWHFIPPATNKSYLEVLSKIVLREQVDLIIPGSDPEIVVLADAEFPKSVTVSISPASTIHTMNDKWETARCFEAHGIPFLPGMLASDYDGRYERWVAKPRIGHGSRGIIGPSSGPIPMRNDETIIQEAFDAPEYTSAFYIQQDRTISGSITFRRVLDGGRTVACEVDRKMDSRVRCEIFEPLNEAILFEGAVNLQFFAPQNQDLAPFEVNCRFSGTSSIRSAFGFNDAEFLVQERLLKEPLPAPQIRRGCAIRTSSDVIFRDRDLDGLNTAADSPIVW